jgi:hypothetical protein
MCVCSCFFLARILNFAIRDVSPITEITDHHSCMHQIMQNYVVSCQYHDFSVSVGMVPYHTIPYHTLHLALLVLSSNLMCKTGPHIEYPIFISSQRASKFDFMDRVFNRTMHQHQFWLATHGSFSKSKVSFFCFQR